MLLEKLNTRFTAEDIRQIRRRLRAGEPRRLIARSYRVSKDTIDNIARGDTFAWVPEDIGDLTDAVKAGDQVELGVQLIDRTIKDKMAVEAAESLAKLERMLKQEDVK